MDKRNNPKKKPLQEGRKSTAARDKREWLSAPIKHREEGAIRERKSYEPTKEEETYPRMLIPA